MPAGAVTVRLADCAVSPVGVIAAGTVAFHAIPPTAADNGGVIHELVIAARGAAGEAPEPIAVIANVLADRPRDLSVDLVPGEYELQCRVAEPGPVASRVFRTVAVMPVTVEAALIR